MFKKMENKKADKLVNAARSFKVSFEKEVRVESFNEMDIFLQDIPELPAYGGAKAMIYTITLPNSTDRTFIEKHGRKVILVGQKFMKLPHEQKLILLSAEYLRTVKNLAARTESNGMENDSIASSTLDRDLAVRLALACEFKPKKIQKAIGTRDGVVRKSINVVSKGVYNTSEDHYKKPKHGFMKNGDKHRISVVNAAENERSGKKNPNPVEDDVTDTVIDAEYAEA